MIEIQIPNKFKAPNSRRFHQRLALAALGFEH
jgi:hypothetical protein